MSVFFISDLHLGHKNIVNWAEKRQGVTSEEHDRWVIDSIKDTVTKRDKLFILGDVAFNQSKLEMLTEIPAKMVLIRGNHDEYPLEEYLKYFDDVLGFVQYKEFWLSHAPVHPAELRDRYNIHGHVHHNPIEDYRYINVCVEGLPTPGKPYALEEIREYTKKFDYIKRQEKVQEFMKRIID